MSGSRVDGETCDDSLFMSKCSPQHVTHNVAPDHFDLGGPDCEENCQRREQYNAGIYALPSLLKQLEAIGEDVDKELQHEE